MTQNNNNYSVVKTIYGLVRGIKKSSIYDKEYLSFQKIPYAEKPIGSFRFRDPVDPKPWDNILDATKQGPACWNYEPAFDETIGDEDCLHINIFTKETTPTILRPVLVCIHGGAFMFGSSGTEMYGPDYFMEENIVLVTFNYRLGAFGFLSHPDCSLNIPGNAGLKDQSKALKWVKDNVKYFGGDCQNITLCGISAGAVSVQYHMISNYSKELFNKAILMSGSALCDWALLQPTNLLERLAIQLGWNKIGGASAAFQVLQNSKAADITAAQYVILTKDEQRNQILFPFGPVIEPYVSENCFISTEPVQMCHQAWGNQIPIILGATSNEGLFLYKAATTDTTVLKDAENSTELFVPNEFKLNINEEKCINIGKQIQRFYFGCKNDTLFNYLNLIADKWFLHGIHRTIKSRQKFAPNSLTYLYRFDFDSENFNYFRFLLCGKGVRGTCHADDLAYLFKNQTVTNRSVIGVREQATINRMISIFTNFAKTGNPNNAEILPTIWKPLNDDTVVEKCLNISDDLSFIEYPENERMQFWDRIYQSFQLI